MTQILMGLDPQEVVLREEDALEGVADIDLG